MLNHSFASEVKRLYKEQKKSTEPDIYIDYDNWSFKVYSEEAEGWVTYQAEPSGKWLHENKDKNLICGILGPFGSGKTTACNADIVLQACRAPFAPNGKRYFHALIVRQTFAELKSTTFESWMLWFSKLGTYQKREQPLFQVDHQFRDEKGIVVLKVTLLALDDISKALRKLKSLDINMAYINEACEMDGYLLSFIFARTGRYKINVIPELRNLKKIVFDTNPPTTSNWIYERFENNLPSRNALYKQPPGLLDDGNGGWLPNPSCENFARLGENYYLDMVNGETEEYIKVFCLGQYGKINTGKLIYPEYNDDIHSISNLEFDTSLPIYIGMDFGLTPAAVFVQLTSLGHINVIAELTSENMDTREFCENILTPYANSNIYSKGIRIEAIIGDPAGNSPHENSKTSSFDILREFGFYVESAPSNLPGKRWDAVKTALNRNIMGKPRFCLSKKCQTLREGFLGEYSFKRLHIRGEKVYSEKASKNKWSHPHDALQYAILHLLRDEKIEKKKWQVKYAA